MVQELDAAFRGNHYADVSMQRGEMAARIGISEANVRAWFQSRRNKHSFAELVKLHFRIHR
jgi:hypothetical protein